MIGCCLGHLHRHHLNKIQQQEKKRSNNLSKKLLLKKIDFIFSSKITNHRYETLNKNIGKHKNKRYIIHGIYIFVTIIFG